MLLDEGLQQPVQRVHDRGVAVDFVRAVLLDQADAGDADATALRDGLAYGVASAIRVIVLSGDVETKK